MASSCPPFLPQTPAQLGPGPPRLLPCKNPEVLNPRRLPRWARGRDGSMVMVRGRHGPAHGQGGTWAGEIRSRMDRASSLSSCLPVQAVVTWFSWPPSQGAEAGRTLSDGPGQWVRRGSGEECQGLWAGRGRRQGLGPQGLCWLQQTTPLASACASTQSDRPPVAEFPRWAVPARDTYQVGVRSPSGFLRGEAKGLLVYLQPPGLREGQRRGEGRPSCW